MSAVPEHTAVGVSVELNTGVGFTVTVTFCVLVQPPAVNVNAYVTVTGAVVPLVRFSLIVAVDPLLVAGVIPATAARDQSKVTPAVSLVAV